MVLLIFLYLFRRKRDFLVNKLSRIKWFLGLRLNGEAALPDEGLLPLRFEGEGEHWKDVHFVNPAERKMANDRHEPGRSPGLRLK
jgi:hypothetical protein